MRKHRAGRRGIGIARFVLTTLVLTALVLAACGEAVSDQSPTATPNPPSAMASASLTPASASASASALILNPFFPAVVLVQGEERPGFERVAGADGAIMLGHSYSAFGASCSEPTDVGERLAWAGDVPKMLYASLAPEDLDWRGTGCAGSDSRLRDDAIEEFARRNLAVAAHDPTITHMNFWNELKGYAMPDEMDVFADHYVRWARTIKAERPDLLLGGPYTHGAFSDETLVRIHSEFIDFVIEPSPDLVDFVVSGDSHRPSTFYTDIYKERGVTLRHWQAEWYPGGHDADTTPTVGAMIEELLEKATNPLMEGVMLWGSGPDSSDGNQVVPLWDDDAHPTDYWWAYVEAARFTARGEIERIAEGRYRNGAGATLFVSEGSVTVEGP